MASRAEARRPPATAFARAYGLRDGYRNDFRLDQNVDAALYVDLDDAIPLVERELTDVAPKLVIEGDFGTGKSHALRYIERVLGPPHGFVPVYLELSGFKRKSDFWDLHPLVMERLLPFAEAAMQAPRDRAVLRQQFEGLSPQMGRALEGLAFRGIGVPHADATAAKQWLLASRYLTPAQANKAGYEAALQEIARPAELVHLYRAVSNLYHSTHGKRLLLLVDEGETFSRIMDLDAQASMGAGLRALLDSGNQSIGFFLGLNTPNARVGVHPMLRSDVRTRIGDRFVGLRGLDASRAERFMQELWPKLSDSHLPPFGLHESARHLVTADLDKLRKAITPPDSLDPQPTPRDLLNLLSKIALGAVESGMPLPVRPEAIKTWFGLDLGA